MGSLLQACFYSLNAHISWSFSHPNGQNIIYIIEIIRLFQVSLKTQVQFADRISSIGRIIG
jgi:hypothetical protein